VILAQTERRTDMTDYMLPMYFSGEHKKKQSKIVNETGAAEN
jgi:hypothetical protein